MGLVEITLACGCTTGASQSRLRTARSRSGMWECVTHGRQRITVANGHQILVVRRRSNG